MIEFKVERMLAQSTEGKTTKRLTVTSWNGAPAKLDLRIWHEGEKPGKGVTLTDEEAIIFNTALNEYLYS